MGHRLKSDASKWPDGKIYYFEYAKAPPGRARAARERRGRS